MDYKYLEEKQLPKNQTAEAECRDTRQISSEAKNLQERPSPHFEETKKRIAGSSIITDKKTVSYRKKAEETTNAATDSFRQTGITTKKRPFSEYPFLYQENSNQNLDSFANRKKIPRVLGSPTGDFNEKRVLSLPPTQEKSEIPKESSEYDIPIVLASIKRIFNKIVFLLMDMNCKLELSSLFAKSFMELEYELAISREEDRCYRILFDLLKEKILTFCQRGTPKYRWDRDVWYKISSDIAKKNLLAQQPCKIYYFFFRFLSLAMHFLKPAMERETKVEFANSVIKLLEQEQVASLNKEGKKCDIRFIFRHCRENTLTKNVLCGCEFTG